MTDDKTDSSPTPLDEIVPYGENPKQHPQEQVDKIASSIRRFGFDQPIVVDGEGTIIKGHGRYQAAQKLGLETVPVVRRPDLSEAEARASRIADNRVAESEWDDDLLALEVQLLDESDLDIEETGFGEEELEPMLAEGPPADSQSGIEYTDKIKTPVYEPTQDEPPALGECYDTERYEELLGLIESADVPDGVDEFLCLAAQRHVVFDYENIAEYYAHADPDVQELMEALTLVIVDYDQAVEQGFVNFAESALEGYNGA